MKIWCYFGTDGRICADSDFRNEREAWRIMLGYPAWSEVEEARKRGARVVQAELTAWYPIDTYRPGVDPDSMLIAMGDVVGEARYHSDEKGWWWAGNDPTDSWGSQVYPDHWQPLPEGPK